MLLKKIYVVQLWKLENCVNGLLLWSDEKLENIYNPELVLDFEQKAIYQSTILYAKKAYEKIDTNSGEILEKMLEWDGTLD